MRKVIVVAFAFVMMFVLVVGAGYNIVVPTVPPATPDSPSGGGGGSSLYVAPNETANDTSEEVVSGDDSANDDVSVVASDVVDFVKGLGWGTVLIVLGVLAVAGGTAWYVLKDKRKKFVEVKTKDKK